MARRSKSQRTMAWLVAFGGVAVLGYWASPWRGHPLAATEVTARRPPHVQQAAVPVRGAEVVVVPTQPGTPPSTEPLAEPTRNQLAGVQPALDVLSKTEKLAREEGNDALLARIDLERRRLLSAAASLEESDNIERRSK